MVELFAMGNSLLRAQKINQKWSKEKGEIPKVKNAGRR